jgi:hypothetical protein
VARKEGDRIKWKQCWDARLEVNATERRRVIIRIHEQEIVQRNRVSLAGLPYHAIKSGFDQASLKRLHDLIDQRQCFIAAVSGEWVAQSNWSAADKLGVELKCEMIFVPVIRQCIRDDKSGTKPCERERLKDLSAVEGTGNRILVPDIRVRCPRKHIMDQVRRRVPKEDLASNSTVRCVKQEHLARPSGAE